MVTLVGLILLALSISLAVAWWPSVVIALQGALVLGLFFVGTLVFLVGYSELKARRDYKLASSPERERAEQAEAESPE